MMSISREIARFLELHVLEYQNKKIEIANRYLADYQKYIRVLDFFNWYILSIENFINQTDVSAGELALPFVIIGSRVEVRGAPGRENLLLHIREPGTAHPNARYDEVSCMSGLGRALLLKRTGQEIEVREGDGVFTGTIGRIEYDFML